MSDRVSPRAPTDTAPVKRWYPAPLPDPPENPEFLLLSDEKQETIAQRFEHGIRLGFRNDDLAHKKAYLAGLGAMHRTRENRKLRSEILERARRRAG